MMKKYKFLKSGKDWYIDLPEFIEQGGSPGDLQMVDGADKLLDLMAEGDDSITLIISVKNFAEVNILVLEEKCHPSIGGGYYIMPEYQKQVINRRIWLCQVTEFVFGDLPNEIYVRKEIDLVQFGTD